MPSFFSRKLVSWYQNNSRDLPWRHTSDPYRIWLSEVILQQTRVNQGLQYYHSFVAKYPTVEHLAAASEDEVLKRWQGLGYYSRARNMLAAARTIANESGGRFPSDYGEIRRLKGIGDYTAAAVASFAFGLPYAVVDGNVYRVLSRYFGITEPIDTSVGKKIFVELAQKELDTRDPGRHNQAIMEFGALLCTPSAPACDECPIAGTCAAFRDGNVNALPKKSKKVKVRTRHFNYLVKADRKGRVAIRRREKKDIWQGLYEFELFESDGAITPAQFLALPEVTASCGEGCRVRHVSPQYNHVLTHQRLFSRFYVLQSATIEKNAVAVSELHRYAFPVLITRFLDDCDLKEMF